MAGKRTETVLISGYAKLPANITSEEVYHEIAVALLVNLETGAVQKAECSVVTMLAKEFLSDLIVGYNLNDGPDGLIERMDRLYYGQTKRAVETALKMIFAKYEEIIA